MRKTLGKTTVLAILCGLFLVGSSGCAAHRPIQQVSDVMDKLTASWFAVESTALSLHDAGILTGDKWNQVVKIRNEASPIMRTLWTEWALLPDTQTAVEEFQRSKNFENALRMIAQLEAMIGAIR